MKSEHRHELKTNELAQLIAKAPQWAKDNRTTIIYVSVFVVLLVAYSFWFNYKKNVTTTRDQIQLTGLVNQLNRSKSNILTSQSQGFDSSYNLLQIAQSFQDFAGNTKNNNMAALALIKRAEALRMELHYRMETVEKANLTTQINDAKQSYTQAIEKAPTDPALIAAARFGLGLCEEELGNFEQAKQIYTQIVEDPALAGTTAVASADWRIKVMDDYKTEVVFKAPARPVSAPETLRPQIDLGPVVSPNNLDLQ